MIFLWPTPYRYEDGGLVRIHRLTGKVQKTGSEGWVDADSGSPVQADAVTPEVAKAFEQVDLIAAPATPSTAFRIGAHTGNPLEMYLEDVFTLPPSLAGICGLSVPCGFDRNRLPVGLQLLGPAFGEATVLRVGHAYEQATEWHKQTPNL